MPKWLHHLEQSINRVRKELNHINLLIKCKKENSYSKHQKKLLNKYRKKLGNTTLRLFEYKSTILKQELKSKSEKLKYQKKLIERKRINRIFQTNPTKVFRSFKENLVILKTMPSQENVEAFWKGIWESRSQVNYENTLWMKQLKKEYCNNVTTKTYQITEDILETAVNKIQPNKAPGRDLTTGFWYRNFDFYKPALTYLFEKTFNGEGELSLWLTTASTVLLPKNNDTHVAKNYRPIALLNIMYKLYKSCINSFLSDHLLRNNIITPEQAGGKQGVWGTIEQLLPSRHEDVVKTSSKRLNFGLKGVLDWSEMEVATTFF